MGTILRVFENGIGKVKVVVDPADLPAGSYVCEVEKPGFVRKLSSGTKIKVAQPEELPYPIGLSCANPNGTDVLSVDEARQLISALQDAVLEVEKRQRREERGQI
jgi:hypothetical protein